MLITISELLESFNVSVDLPEHLYSVEISSSFKDANFVCNGDIFEFSKSESMVIISPNSEVLIKIIHNFNGKKFGRVYSKEYSYTFN